MSDPGYTHRVRTLVDRLAAFGEYPPGVAPPPVEDAQRIPGTAFFPAGFGLWNPDGGLPELPTRPVVIVGHNWGDLPSYRAIFNNRAEYLETWPEKKKKGQPTWWNLIPLLREGGVGPEECFFTNALMGLKNDGKGCRGPMSEDPTYRRKCREFLKFQLETLRPSVVITLGEDAKDLLYQVAPNDVKSWRGPNGGDRGILDIYRAGGGVVYPVSIGTATPCVAVPLFHTCERRNMKYRAQMLEHLQKASLLIPNVIASEQDQIAAFLKNAVLP